MPKLKIDVVYPRGADDAFWPRLGYYASKVAGPEIPIVYGLDTANPRISDLKAFGAAFATTASALMFHIAGISPEASRASLSSSELPCYTIGKNELEGCWNQLNTGTDNLARTCLALETLTSR